MRAGQGEAQIGCMVGGGEVEREAEHPGDGWGGLCVPWCWARCEGHVAKHQISWAAGLGGVRLCSSKNGIIKCSRGISVFLCSLCGVWVARPRRARIKRGALKRRQLHNLCDLETCVLMPNTFPAPYMAAWLCMKNCTWLTNDCLNGWLMQHSKWHKSVLLYLEWIKSNAVLLLWFTCALSALISAAGSYS